MHYFDLSMPCEEVYYIHNEGFLGRAGQTLPAGPKMVSESKGRRLGRVLWQLGVGGGEGSGTRGQGLVWFESPAVPKGGAPKLSYQLAQTQGTMGREW